MLAMDLSTHLDYDADPATVFAMICDPEFLARKAEATKAESHEASVEPRDDGGAEVRLTRVMPAQVPDLVRRFVGEKLTVTQTDTWGPAETSGAREGTFVVEIAGAPASVRGRLSLSGSDKSTKQEFDGEIKVSVPFIGGKIEQMVSEALLAAVKSEGRVGREWLAEQR
jgi:uncharacterized protein YndB with AHSA1/START domain